MKDESEASKMHKIVTEPKELKIEPSETATTIPLNEFLEVRVSPCKGLGCYAVADIPLGKRILAEEPLFLVPKPCQEVNVEAAVKGLSQSDREAFMTLHSPNRPTLSPIMRTFEANSVEVGPNAGIFIKSSRFNHSCIPNAFHSWNEKLGHRTIHALSDIHVEQEVTISYHLRFRTRE